MKLKGVNPIEQHIEKIVLGIMLVLLLGVLSMQFVQRPNDVEVGSRSVAPDQIYSVLKSQADQLQSQLTDFNPGLPEVAPVDLVSRYDSAFEGASGGSVQLSAALGDGVNITGDGGGGLAQVVAVNDGPLAGLEVPRTSTPIAASMWSTLDPYAVELVPEYEAHIPSAQPFDFPSVSIESSFSGKELESALMGDGNADNAIPRRFWASTGLAILGFEAQRQELMADGSWGSFEEIEVPPHTPTPTQAMADESGLVELAGLVNTASKVIDDVARPMFPPTIAGDEWTPPSERIVSENESESTEVTRLQRQLTRATADLERLNAASQSTGRGGSGKTGNRNTNNNSDRNKVKIDRLTIRIEDLKEQLTELGEDPDAVTQTAGRVKSSANDVKSILEDDDIVLWAHDLGVTPGATYRYRTRVVVNNPLFRKGGELDPDDASQQALTQNPFVHGQWSDWSDEVIVGAQEYFFVTGGATQDRFGMPDMRASIEIYSMYYGHYRKSTISLSPGDELASTVRVSSKSLLMFETQTIDAQEAAKAVLALDDTGSDELPEGIVELSGRFVVDLGAYLLDIYTGNESGGHATPMHMVIRDQDGQVVVRSDVEDKSSPSFDLAASSASQASKTPIREPGGEAISPSAELFKVPGP